MSMLHHPVRDQMSQHPMEHRMLNSRNVQSIIETLDPRRKFLDLAKKNVFDEPQKEVVVETPKESPKRIDEKINDAMKDTTTETFKPASVNAPTNTTPTTVTKTEKFNSLCALSSGLNVNRVNTTVCIVIEIILLLLTFLVCLVSFNCYSRFTRKQIELTKETCKQNKKIIKLLKSMMN